MGTTSGIATHMPRWRPGRGAADNDEISDDGKAGMAHFGEIDEA